MPHENTHDIFEKLDGCWNHLRRKWPDLTESERSLAKHKLAHEITDIIELSNQYGDEYWSEQTSKEFFELSLAFIQDEDMMKVLDDYKQFRYDKKNIER